MKPTQRQIYADRIERVIDHLQNADFGAVPDLEVLASVAALSPFHFHRIYRLMTGETLADTVKRIRLARAVPALNQSIMAATEAAGYATSQGLARALKAETGHTASEIRVSADIRQSLEAAMRRPSLSDRPMAIEIVTTEPLTLTALRNTGAYPELNAAYGRLFEQVFSGLPMEALRGLYGYLHDDPRVTAPEDCRAEVAVDVGGEGALIDDLYHIGVPAGRCARLRHLGDYDAIQPSVDALYDAVIERGEAIGVRPILFHYLDDPETVAEADLRADLYLPLA
ncbi:MAG: GyrI-like domain-containing protein [Asticcacaulis sp. 32-58-5]|nr:MAG: GyrI-like domain-containing protein [Asticcacaulis sp. 32-58-5]